MRPKGPGRVVDINDLNPEDQLLVKEANEARKFAYCPYSNFAVGSAIRVANNTVYRGCNVESSVFAPSVCAERTAIIKAVSEGQQKVVSIAVVAFQENTFTPPCGICRQVLCEFADETLQIYMSKPDSREVLCATLEELLPLAFHTSFN